METQNFLVKYSIHPSVRQIASEGQECTASTIQEFADHLARLRANNPIDPVTGTDEKNGWIVNAPRLDPAKTWTEDNIAPRNWLMLDLDLSDEQGAPIPLNMDALRQWLGMVNSLLWATHSYTPEQPKCRVCLFLDRDIGTKAIKVGSETLPEYKLAVRGAMAMLRDAGIVNLFLQGDQSHQKANQGMFSIPARSGYLAITDGADLASADTLLDKGRIATLEEQSEIASKLRQNAQYEHPAPLVMSEAGNALERQAQAILTAQASALETAPKGSRHRTCLSVAQTIGGLIAGGYIPEPEGRSVLMSVVRAIAENGDDQRDFAQAIRDGIAHGMDSPIDLANDPRWKRQKQRQNRPHHQPLEYIPPEDAGAWMDVDTATERQNNAPPNLDQEQERPFTLLDGLQGLADYLTTRGGRKLRTGIQSLDLATDGGLSCGLHVIGGLPASGKTALALEIALNHVRSGGRVLYLSLEIDRFELSKRVAQRIYARETGETITDNGLTECAKEDKKAFEDVLFKGRELWHTQANALEIWDLERLGSDDIDRISTEIEAFRERCSGNDKLPLVIVDYLQYVHSKNRNQDRRILLIEIAQKLKAETLKGEGLVVLGLSSLNRDSYYDRPCIEMLKEAGEIEYTAGSVHILGYRFRTYPNKDAMKEFVSNHKNDPIKYCALYCLKNRHSSPKDAFIDFDAETMSVRTANNPNPYPEVDTLVPPEKGNKRKGTPKPINEDV
jgi:replicative DNA helicase